MLVSSDAPNFVDDSSESLGVSNVTFDSSSVLDISHGLIRLFGSGFL